MIKISFILLCSLSVLSTAHASITLDKERYQCDDQINAAFVFTGESRASLSLQFKWIAPTGRTQDIAYIDADRNYVEYRAWLSLERPLGSNLVSWLEPSVGLLDFIGEWTVEVLADGKKVSETNFLVEC